MYLNSVYEHIGCTQSTSFLSLGSCHILTFLPARWKVHRVTKKYGVVCSASWSQPAMNCQATGNSNLSVQSQCTSTHPDNARGKQQEDNEEGRRESRVFFLFDQELRSKNSFKLLCYTLCSTLENTHSCGYMHTDRLTNMHIYVSADSCWLLIISSLCLTFVGDCYSKT